MKDLTINTEIMTYCLFKWGNIFFVAIEESELYYDYCERFGNPYISGTIDECISYSETF